MIGNDRDMLEKLRAAYLLPILRYLDTKHGLCKRANIMKDKYSQAFDSSISLRDRLQLMDEIETEERIKGMWEEQMGRKNDQGKSRLDLISPNALLEVGQVMRFGAEKYGEYNYLGGMSWTRLAGAILRHTYQWLKGEDLDPESGISHLAHAAASALMLLEYVKRDIGDDNRFKGATE